jgi:glycosyltransferase involved in cell wall biosynthesis
MDQGAISGFEVKIKKEHSVLIIGQHLTSRTEAVRDFLLSRTDRVAVIALGSAFVDKKANHFFDFEKGKLEKHYVFHHGSLKKIKSRALLIPATFFLYFFDILCILFVLRRRVDLCIGISHFPGLVGAMMKSTGICRKTVYYAIDYYMPHKNPGRFISLLLKVENFADRIAVLISDEVWNISTRIVEARDKFNGIKNEKYANKSKIVPLGYSKKFFRNKGAKDIDRYAVVFVGVIVEGQGLELILEALPEIKRIIPTIQIRVIGTGPFLSRFRGMVSSNHLEDIFRFYGFIESENEMLEVISSSAVGISLWDNRINKFLNSYTGDPGKTKLYSACGLPAIVSNSTVYSKVVTEGKAGIAINYECKELVGAMNTILSDDDAYYEYKTNAIITASDYCDSEIIFSKVLN